MLRIFWFHFGFKEKTDVTLRWQCEFFGFIGHATHGLIKLLEYFRKQKHKFSILTMLLKNALNVRFS